MLARGVTKQHLDSRDLVSVIAGITPAQAGGCLVYQSGHKFVIGPGDFAVVPSSVVKHGNRYCLTVGCLLLCCWSYSVIYTLLCQ